MVKKPALIPFQIGTPIQDPAAFIGRKKILQRVSSAMLNMQNISLRGERRTGKTSLLLYLAHLSSISKLGLPENHIPVYFNFQEFTEASASRVWLAIAAAISEQIKSRYPNLQTESGQFFSTLRDPFATQQEIESFSTAFKDALYQLSNSGLKIHLLFDEFDQTVRNRNLGDTFYDTLRSLPTSTKNLSYVVATREGLSELQTFYAKISSPFFNIFTNATLKPFEKKEVFHLIFEYFARAETDISLAERLCDESSFLYEVTGYHPFFIQTLCCHLYERLDYPDWPRGQAQTEALCAFEEDSKLHFKDYWKFSKIKDRILMEKLASGESIDWNQSETSAAINRLEARCLVVQTPDKVNEWQLFSSVFGDWIGSGIEIEKEYQSTDAFISIPAGSCFIGSASDDPEAEENEKPQRELETGEYSISRYPVTNAEYARFVLYTGHEPLEHWEEGRVPEGLENHPVVLVSYKDAEAYCRWFSRITKRHCRLPTEEEWERAARGDCPEKRRYPWGDDFKPDHCNTKELGLEGTTPVYKFEQTNRSPFQVVDMVGNVWEWTSSWYERYPDSDYHTFSYGRTYRVVRGGSWHHSCHDARLSCRGRYEPDIKRKYLGFRVVLAN